MNISLRRKAPAQSLDEPQSDDPPSAGWVVRNFETMADSALLGPGDVAALTGYTTSAIYAWRARGFGPVFLNVNGRPRTTAGLYREWLASRPLITKAKM